MEKVTVCNENGLHIRPASMVAKCASKFQSSIELEANGQKVDARGIFEVLLLAANKGTTVTITATGPDSVEATRAIATLFKEGFPFENIPDELG
ncbi:MAG: HPr family phosphocarrier protein [Planctomycetia bacterium]|nr:HPr family phosphocarrier protein [Planctomycetia bacterium]